VDDGCHWDLVRADAEAMAFAQGDVEQLALELFPQTADITLPEWEAFFGLDTIAGLTRAQRQARVTAMAKAAQACTPANIRSMLAGLLEPFLAFSDPCDDVSVSYRLEQQPGNGVIAEVVTDGLRCTITSPAQGDWSASAWHAPTVLLPPLVDRNDDFLFAAKITAYTLNAETGGGLVLFENETDCYLFGPWRVGATTLLRVWKIEAGGTRTQVASVAMPALPCTLRCGRVEGQWSFQYGAFASDPMTDTCSLLYTESSTIKPRKVGIFAANYTPYNTVSFTAKDLELRYATLANNVEWIEPLAAHVPAGGPEAIFIAFAHRHPDYTGECRIAEAQRILDRVKWGHCLFLVGESDNFLTDDVHSLTDRDMLGR
jgi:hypothetical protein